MIPKYRTTFETINIYINKNESIYQFWLFIE